MNRIRAGSGNREKSEEFHHKEGPRAAGGKINTKTHKENKKERSEGRREDTKGTKKTAEKPTFVSFVSSDFSS
jgi:hypothetical protein